ncbi:hypothetical protein IC229_26620 [Spirosoma sp. BT702]|uniref:G8 domain-containing protein n=1 Tax=Spirosoma profusum TaxID=2771354 RepID=A0A927ASQ1_9BACT|nr:GEVED domain-containing protein [Spirosoma profusum]MBD2704246.1 hypothetical protein [Spirosoma profusum]
MTAQLRIFRKDNCTNKPWKSNSSVSEILKKWSLVVGFYLAAQLVCFGQSKKFICGNDSIAQAFGKTNSLISSGEGRSLNAKQVQEALEDTTTYIVPVVFIIFHKGEPVGTGSNIPDSAVQYMLDLINDRYAGIGLDGYRGQDSKIRFKFAKRTQACNPTTGIVRVDGRSVPGYEANGFINYTIQAQLAALVPDFIDNSVRSGVLTINIYHYVPGGAFAFYGGPVHMMAPTPEVLTPYNYVPAHEVGHSLQLYHTYQGSVQQGNSYTCPGDTYNDYVEDTQPTRMHDPDTICYPGVEELTNSCTGLAFGTQIHNMMSYGCNQDRFTPGQIARMRYYLANDYKSLGASEMYKPITPTEAPVAVACALSTPPAVSTLIYGIATFQFNTIDSQAGLYSSRYADYTCAYQTKATLGQTLSMSVTGYGTFGRVYIDYNSDGAFDESTEQVMAFTTNSPSERLTFTQSVTIPQTAVVGRILHVRVIFDNGDVPPTACNIPGKLNQGFGEIEDYGLLLSAPNCESIRSGNWNDAATWSCGQVPLAQSDVVIHAGHTVSLTEATPNAVCRKLVLHGTLLNQNGSIYISEN